MHVCVASLRAEDRRSIGGLPRIVLLALHSSLLSPRCITVSFPHASLRLCLVFPPPPSPDLSPDPSPPDPPPATHLTGPFLLGLSWGRSKQLFNISKQPINALPNGAPSCFSSGGQAEWDLVETCCGYVPLVNRAGFLMRPTVMKVCVWIFAISGYGCLYG